MHKSPHKPGEVIVGMSGGVDSAVTALLLKQGGWQVRAMFMKNWEEDDTRDHCSATIDLEDATEVCKQLDIPLETVNFSYEYWQRVFKYFLAEYQLGHTPNPDVLCNREIKFKVFLEYCLDKGADFIATGHYARLQQKEQQTLLLRGLDSNKDQSYFLHAVPQSALQRSLFPLGAIPKTQVRRLAREAGLQIHGKRDSTGICFIGERNFRAFLSRFLPACAGDMVDPNGTVLGRHNGLMYYTIGQRQGLGIGGAGGPRYVAAKNLQENTLLVVNDRNHPALLSTALRTDNPHWTTDTAPQLPLHCKVQTRYRQTAVSCQVHALNEGLEVRFQQPHHAIAPGQYAVFYDHNHCLGGARIRSRDNLLDPWPAP